MSEMDYTIMSRDELERELRRLRDNLEDLEDTFAFNLTNTSAHLNSGVVAEAEEELEELRVNISSIEAILKG